MNSARFFPQDNLIFEKFLESFEDKTYQELFKLPEREQVILTELSPYSTIEISKKFHEVDRAIAITTTLFLWATEEDLAELHYPNLTQNMNIIMEPIANPSQNLIYSGHCQTELFYVLPDNSKTNDIFCRNEIAEKNVVETADWFNKTGLSYKEETELPKYVRSEYGILLVDPDTLKANDLTFLGHFPLNPNLQERLNISDVSNLQKELYVWHYFDNHFAFAYRNIKEQITYMIDNYFPKELL